MNTGTALVLLGLLAVGGLAVYAMTRQKTTTTSGSPKQENTRRTTAAATPAATQVSTKAVTNEWDFATQIAKSTGDIFGKLFA